MLFKNKALFVLWLIILIGAFFRLYNSYAGLRFLSDEAAVMNGVEQIWLAISNFDFRSLPLQGPEAGTLPHIFEIPAHHGAFYFYSMAPAVLISNFHPYGLALFTILLNVVSIYFMFLVGRKIFDTRTGLLSALLLAVSSFAIHFSRWAWSPNLIIFFCLLTFLSFLKIKEGDQRYWPLFGFSAVGATQIYIFGYFFVPMVFLAPLFITSVVYPKGKKLILTAVFALLPVIPEILSEMFSRFSLVRYAFKFTQGFFIKGGESFDNLTLLLLSIPKEILGIRDQTIVGVSLFLVTTVLFTIILLYSIFHSQKFFSAFPRLMSFLFVSWFFATVFMALLFSIRYRITDYTLSASHPLLFGVPLILLVFAGVLRFCFSLKLFFPVGVILLSIFLYVNISDIPSRVWHALQVTFKDQKELVEYVVKEQIRRKQSYTVEISNSAEAGALMWLFQHSRFPPERSLTLQQVVTSAGDNARIRYQIFVGDKDKNVECNGGVPVKSFGAALTLQSCPRGI